MASWRITVRSGPRVERARFDSMLAAVGALEGRMQELAPQAKRRSIKVFKRQYDAVRQVAVRGEVAGPSRVLPSVRGGVDMRGDGSTEAFTGQWRRALIALEPGETAFDGLRRALAESA